MAPWNRRFLLGTIIFRFHVKIGEGIREIESSTFMTGVVKNHLNLQGCTYYMIISSYYLGCTVPPTHPGCNSAIIQV